MLYSKFYLLEDINWSRENEEVVDFDNKDLQSLYFNNRKVLGYEDTAVYIRKESGIRVQIPEIVVSNYSYLTFTNYVNGQEKTFYAFIDNVRYLNAEVSFIEFTIDVFQTYMFDYTIKDSFIDREHQDRWGLIEGTKQIVYGASKNEGVPKDLEEKEYVGDGWFILNNDDGIEIKYNIYTAIYELNGSTTKTTGFSTLYTFPHLSGQYTLQIWYESGTATSGDYYIGFNSESSNYSGARLRKTEPNYDFYSNTMSSATLRIGVSGGNTYNKYRFRIQAEKGLTPTEYEKPNIYYVYELEPKFNDEVENIEVGEEYVVENREVISGQGNQVGELSTNIKWLEVVATSPIFKEEDLDEWLPPAIPFEQKPYETMEGINIPLYVIYLPFMSYGTDKISFHYDALTNWLGRKWYNLNANEPKLLSVRVENYVPFDFDYDFEIENINIGTTEEPIMESVSKVYIDNVRGVGLNKVRVWRVKGSVDGGTGQRAFIQLEKYVGVRKIFEKDLIYLNEIGKNVPRRIENEVKIQQSPYKVYSVFNPKGESLNLSPQYLKNKIELMYGKSISFNNKHILYQNNYLGDSRGRRNNVIDNTVNELPLTNNEYKQYMLQHKASSIGGMAVAGVKSLAGFGMLTAGGIAPLLGRSMAIGGAEGIASELLKIRDLKRQPDSERNSGNDLVFDLLNARTSYELLTLEITEPQKQKLYDYLYRFGYKANRFGTPDLRSRYYFNFVKCIELNIVGSIPNNIKQQLKEIYKNGVRIWHSREDNINVDMFNYDYENAEMSILELEVNNE